MLYLEQLFSGRIVDNRNFTVCHKLYLIDLKNFEGHSRELNRVRSSYWEILHCISMMSITELLAKCDDFLHVLLEDHGPEVLNCIVFGSLRCNDQAIRLIQVGNWIWINFSVSRLYEAGVNILALLNILYLLRPWQVFVFVIRVYHSSLHEGRHVYVDVAVLTCSDELF